MCIGNINILYKYNNNIMHAILDSNKREREGQLGEESNVISSQITIPESYKPAMPTRK